MSIRFDYTDAFAPDGPTKKELRALQPRLCRIQKHLQAEQKAGRLGFADLPADRDALRQVKQLLRRERGGLESVVVLGIGGSALGFLALKEALLHPLHNQLARQAGKPAFYVLDNIDPETVGAVLDAVDPRRTLVNVITKSGSTAETIGQFLLFFEMFAKKLGGRREAVKRFVLTTDPQHGPLRPLIDKEGFGALPIPANVGGRFSALSPVGLFPAALAGLNIDRLLYGASAALRTGLYSRVVDSPALLGAGLHVLHYARGRRIAVMMPYANGLLRVADWFRQLWAESLGKAVDRQGRPVYIGPTPVAALGATDQHSQVQLYVEGPDDKFYTFLRVEKMRRDLRYPRSPWPGHAFDYFKGHSMFELLDAEAEATRFALTEQGRPCATIRLPKVDEDALGRLFMHLELQTVAAGELFEVNAFDQPGVEAGKRYAFGLLGRPGYEREAKRIGKRRGQPLVIEG